ncbi:MULTISPECIES: PCC domain-containing protein [unclassified Streptomyces]|uniref:PCC domain-containing protein n=1 Tax=unclassified Streptomyces TaxID=2593676 RepID=UPI002DDB25E2|nr:MULTISPECIES: DUF296 domain-containing protein [unclassified Streptomyces]WSA90711.1 DNA-binding protein [Streptomyces sp. NBC_01795]WSB75035.1 DNA-binding protein [Streptomyces sp. NBC_01775]WSS16685.1 DNA-binding protein [Streptomyces sp. NBC_01186]WSS45503.1 DNA-binding protein [Streptomyces sp. NBC_01187]
MPARSEAVPVSLPAGAPLADALAELTVGHGATSAQAELLGGTLGHVSYCVPAVCTDGSAAVGFSAARTARGPANVIAGSVTVGLRDDAPFVHCHAAWIDAGGVIQAGHVRPETTVGRVPLHAVLHPLPGVRNTSAVDPETRLPVFTPTAARADIPAGGGRVAFSRVLPGENVRDAAEQVCRDQGFRRAVVRATLGSLVGPTLRRDDSHHTLEGPAAEVISLLGEVGPDADPAGQLHTLVVDSAGAVHGGVLVAENSPVAVTMELLIIEDEHIQPGAAHATELWTALPASPSTSSPWMQ